MGADGQDRLQILEWATRYFKGMYEQRVCIWVMKIIEQGRAAFGKISLRPENYIQIQRVKNVATDHSICWKYGIDY